VDNRSAEENSRTLPESILVKRSGKESSCDKEIHLEETSFRKLRTSMQARMSCSVIIGSLVNWSIKWIEDGIGFMVVNTRESETWKRRAPAGITDLAGHVSGTLS